MLIIMLCLIAVCFCACGELNSVIITHEDGRIEENVSISLDATAVLNAGYNVAELKREIRTDAINQATKMKNALNTKIDNHLLLVTDNETIEVLESYRNGISVLESYWQDDMFSISIVFDNVNVYMYYYNIDENVSVEMYEEKHFLYNKLYWYGNTMYICHTQMKIYDFYFK